MTIKTIFSSLAVAACIALPVQAQVYPGFQSFNITNGIAAGATGAVTNSPPLGSPGTNGVCIGTGQAIGLPNNDRVLLSFQGSNSTTDVGNFVFTLVRSDKTSPPSVTNDFESTHAYIFTVPMNGQHIVHWMTNLDNIAIGAISYIGVDSISNTAAAGILTNGVLAISTKVTPIRYP